MQLQTAVDHRLLQLADIPFTLRSVDRVQLAGVEGQHRFVGIGFGDVDLGGHLGEFEPDVLLAGQRLAEGRSLTAVFDGVIEDGAGIGDRLGGDAEPLSPSMAPRIKASAILLI
jgi:hypothetical protein